MHETAYPKPPGARPPRRLGTCGDETARYRDRRGWRSYRHGPCRSV